MIGEGREVLAEALLLAWIEGLCTRTPAPAVRVRASVGERVPLDDTGRAPIVPLAPNGGDRG